MTFESDVRLVARNIFQTPGTKFLVEHVKISTASTYCQVKSQLTGRLKVKLSVT